MRVLSEAALFSQCKGLAESLGKNGAAYRESPHEVRQLSEYSGGSPSKSATGIARGFARV